MIFIYFLPSEALKVVSKEHLLMLHETCFFFVSMRNVCDVVFNTLNVIAEDPV